MADKATPIVRGGKVVGYKGSMSSQSFKGKETEDQRLYQQFLKDKKWDGIAGAARMPKRDEVVKQWRAWKTARAKSEGQKKAIASAKTE